MNDSDDSRSIRGDQFLPLHQFEAKAEEGLIASERIRSEHRNVNGVREKCTRKHAGSLIALLRP